MKHNLSCNESHITPYVPDSSNPWNIRQVNHLYRRAAFGAPISVLNSALTKSPDVVVDELIDEALTIPLTPAPEWGYWYKDEVLANDLKASNLRVLWEDQIITEFLTGNLRERLVLFWSNHFVTQASQYIGGGSSSYQYHKVLQENAIGNFKTFTREVGLTTAMLYFLNGTDNVKSSPNENYGRELYELFTLGLNNGYDETDIRETARALTGYSEETVRWGPFVLNEDDFDDGEKTIFGQTGAWGYDDVIDILFEQRPDQIATFVCGKLYKYFVEPVINDEIVSELAQTFKDNDFELAPVFRQLFKSAHFFDTATHGVIIKSPADVLVPFIKELSLVFDEEYLLSRRVKQAMGNQGQKILEPIDVRGWLGGEDWIGSNTLIDRWDDLDTFIQKTFVIDRSTLAAWAVELMGGEDTFNDEEAVVKAFINFFFTNDLIGDTEFNEALSIFKDRVPVGYFDDGTWDLRWGDLPRQVYDTIRYLVTVPEFQLK